MCLLYYPCLQIDMGMPIDIYRYLEMITNDDINWLSDAIHIYR